MQVKVDQIRISNVPEEFSEPVLVKIAFDWLFLDYFQKLPEPSHQLSFLTPWFLLKKPGKWQTPWEQLWEEVFPTPVLHRSLEFSREYLIRRPGFWTRMWEKLCQKDLIADRRGIVNLRFLQDLVL